MPRGRRRSRRRRRPGAPGPPQAQGAPLAGRREAGGSRERAGLGLPRWAPREEVLGGAQGELGLAGLVPAPPGSAAGPAGLSHPWAAPVPLLAPLLAPPAPRAQGSGLPAALGIFRELAGLAREPGPGGSRAGAAPRLRTVYVNPRWLERQAALAAAPQGPVGPQGPEAASSSPGPPPATQGEPCPEAASPYVGLRRPLGYQLAKATKERIWRGEFIDLFSLLHTELAPEHEPGQGLGDTLDQWVSAFLVYASVLCEKHPNRCGAMFKYLDVIRKFHATYGGTSWLHYDEDFRRLAAKDPTMAWGDVDLNLWMKWMAPLKPSTTRQPQAAGDQQAPLRPQNSRTDDKSQTSHF
ncbi:collagen alpha-1(I) chain-like [Malaclemys terrapin pileata]|uniref:collagen alpha-1(II) chain-like n=1 Tax=Chrysemys picta bellii TaxID=8478 RepID=UPI0003891A04|nr:collagen alpha-1(I) chain-like [Chrysemys picta bellii]XP_042696097.1 collagen alpha-1(I) chain-like [Chrysemys picta bellii]XP_053863816.1 collagen alpha-1(I) chain-like [Malaclemys terrapin pileata]XP_053863826.1 collagen alpha-1(I) chain-like [Malaclemys terrapin pileata]